MGRKGESQQKWLLYGFIVFLLLFFQKLTSWMGRIIADSFHYEYIDPYKAFLWVSIHHLIEMLITLAVILMLSRLLKIDFGFGFSDRGKGTKYVLVFTAIFAVVTLVSHIIFLKGNSLLVYEFPLNSYYIFGTLGFQLFLSGPAEELLFRALPISLLIYIFGKSIKTKWGITLETIIASFLFALAHATCSLTPLTFEADYFQLFYAFILGTINGIAYQDCNSVVYPMLMHSISNVLMVGTGYLFSLL